MSTKALFFFFLTITAILAFRVLIYFSTIHHFTPGDAISIETTLFSDPKEAFGGQNFSLKLPDGQTAFVTAKLPMPLSYGDEIKLEGRLSERKSGSPRGEAGEKSYLVLNQPQIIVKSEAKNPVLAVAKA